MADILNQIDDAITRNAARFDPLGEAWDADRVYRSGDEMRVVPARTVIEEEAVEPEAVVEEFAPNQPRCACGVWVAASDTRCARCARCEACDGRPGAHAGYSVRHTCARFAEPPLRVIPGPDRVHDAFRREVIRQGFSTYSVDGVEYTVDSQVMMGFDGSPDGYACILIARVDSEGHVHTEVLPPPVDAALQPDPDKLPNCCPPARNARVLRNGHNIYCTARDCEIVAPDGTDASWGRLDRAFCSLLRLGVRVGAWWRRILPGGTR